MTKQTPLERILGYADKTPGFGRDGDCWEWTMARNLDGYGMTWLWGQTVVASRAVYILINGLKKLDKSQFVLHSCDNPPCCNPAHLSLGTAKKNAEEMVERGRYVSAQSQKLHCSEGHPYSFQNTYINPSNRQRVCRICQRAYNKKYRALRDFK